MKTTLKYTLASLALGLISLSSFPAIAQDKPAAISGPAVKGPVITPESGDASPELKKAAEAVAKAMDRKDCEKAFEFMTPKGENEFIGTMLLQLASMTQVDGAGDAEIPAGFKKLQELAKELGIDVVQMPQFAPTGAPDDLDRLIKEMDAVREKLLACVPENDRRKAILSMMELMSQAFASPMSLDVGPIEITGDHADVALVMKLDPAFAAQVGGAAPAMGDEAGPAEYLTFVKQDGAWKFDGMNTKRTMLQMAQRMSASAEPFTAIENFSIEGKTIDEKAISLADYTGKVVLVDFWGTWCGPCVASLPELAGLHEKYNAKGFEILGVAADEADTLREFLKKKPLAWAHVVDAESEIATKYEIEAFPTTLLIDKQGKHVATNLHGDSLTKAIELLLDGKTIESINGNAKDILAAGQKLAATEKKLVFLHFGASWCQPCKALEKWMAQPEIHKLLADVFVDVRIDTDHNFGASELMSDLTEADASTIGIPWFAIMNANDAKPTITSNAEKTGNIGMPDSPEGQAHFVKMFESTGKFSKEQLELILSSIQQAAKDLEGEKSK